MQHETRNTKHEIRNTQHAVSWTLILFLWLAFALRVWRLGAQSLWYDEGYSAYLGAHLPLGQALDLTVRDIVPPLYYLLLRGWLPFAGTSEFALRFLSVSFGVVAVALMARIGRRLGGERAGLLSAALATIAPVLVWLSQDARMYGPLVTWSLLSTWGLLRAVAPTVTQRSRRRGWALFVGAGLAALYTHTVAVFWLMGQGVFGLLAVWRQRRQKQRVREALVALGLMAVGYLPWVIVALVSYRTNAGYWPGYLPPAHLWRIAWEAFVGGRHLSQAQTSLAAVWFGVVTLLGWLILLFKRPRIAVYLFCYLVIPLLAMGIVFQHTPKLAPRYPTAMAPALFLALATSAKNWRMANSEMRIAHHALRITHYSLLIGVILLSLRADANLCFDADYGKDDWRAAASYVQAHRRPDEAVLLISGHAFPVFAYYYGWEGWHALPGDVQLDITHVLNYPAVAPRLNRILAGAGGVWLVLWQDEVVDPTRLVPALLGDVGRELPAPSFRGASAGDQVELRHFELQTAVHFPDGLPVQHRLRQAVAPGLTSLGYTPPTVPIPADAEVSLRVFWRAEQPLQGAHAASLRLSDRLGQEWARRDALLAGPWYFSERWPVGTPVMGHYTVTLPLGAPPGTYTPTLQVYRGDEAFEALPLSPLVITRPVNAPTPSALGLPSAAGAAGELSLVGVGFDQQTVTPCQDWYLSLAWRTEARPAHDYDLRLNAGPDQVETALAIDYPTTRWQPGDVWRTRHHVFINCRALDGTVPVSAQLLDTDGQPVGDPLGLGEITVVAGRQFTLPTDLTAVLDVQLRPEPVEGLADVGTLAGYRLEKDRLQPGENLQVALYWRAGRGTDNNYSVFVHLESDPLAPAPGAGGVWAQHDGWPGDSLKPTSTWAYEEVIADRHIVSIGEDVPPGAYRLVVGMYDPATLEPLAAFEPDGRPIQGGRIVLQPITVYVP
jgi:mannosyltransferase